MNRVSPNGLMFTRSTPSVFGSTRRTSGRRRLPAREVVRELVKEAASAVGGHKFSLHFLLTEWEQVVDAWQLENWEAYRDVVRLGRKTRLPEAQRTVLWSIFERVRAGLKTRKLITHAELFTSLAAAISKNKNVVFDFAVVDEAQDISVAHLRFFAALGGGRPNALFFAGDLGPAHLPAALLLEGPRRGHPGALAHLARQLPHLPPNPHAGGPPARPGGDRRGWQQRGPERHGFRVQRPAADDSLAQERKRGDQDCRQLDCGTGKGRCAAARVRRVRPIRGATGSCASCRQGSGHGVQDSR